MVQTGCEVPDAAGWKQAQGFGELGWPLLLVRGAWV